MAAFVVVEMEVKDAAAKDRYSRAAVPTIKEFGGEFVATGAWTQLAGEAGLKNGAIIRFESRDRARAWYHSTAYQAALEDRDAGMTCRFHLLG
ncbi:DUF1330 domain-containing protein [Bradyrhizobium iriomotense]|uniref:DUF1330 domain-containing protein n=1 Tax=Bradyrhizobium iriomotense TaxID=441950 RepID=A0ABQ6B814_9BRAD|nr:DUF1330 domain-containing protein [Bradyrhizobium iriomotense]GLR90549.1 hypothetical protein GCM10007857_72640 [Bradyrhizobium iriomotense]